ncbi:MAG: hypothetical protein JSV94_03480 [Methanobacteriota archaeon]|nr:MAG: hypothetical protein JSV94_03480 [Euryarchaeota archaeon]
MDRLICREIERQFRKAAHQAEIVVDGKHMSKEVFRGICEVAPDISEFIES